VRVARGHLLDGHGGAGARLHRGGEPLDDAHRGAAAEQRIAERDDEGPVERGRGAQDRVAEPQRPRLVEAHHLGPVGLGEVRREGAAPAPGHEHHALDPARHELVDDVLHHGAPRHRQQPLRHAARERAQSGRQPGDRHDGGGDGHGRGEASARVVRASSARVARTAPACCAARTAASRATARAANPPPTWLPLGDAFAPAAAPGDPRHGHLRPPPQC